MRKFFNANTIWHIYALQSLHGQYSGISLLTFQRPMFRSYKNKSVDLLLTCFYVMVTLAVNRLKFSIVPKSFYL